jgi:hypothetical protein
MIPKSGLPVFGLDHAKKSPDAQEGAFPQSQTSTPRMIPKSGNRFSDQIVRKQVRGRDDKA